MHHCIQKYIYPALYTPIKAKYSTWWIIKFSIHHPSKDTVTRNTLLYIIIKCKLHRNTLMGNVLENFPQQPPLCMIGDVNKVFMCTEVVLNSSQTDMYQDKMNIDVQKLKAVVLVCKTSNIIMKIERHMYVMTLFWHWRSNLTKVNYKRFTFNSILQFVYFFFYILKLFDQS